MRAARVPAVAIAAVLLMTLGSSPALARGGGSGGGSTPPPPPPPASTLAAPAPGAPAGVTVQQPVTLSWSAPSSATQLLAYDWQVATTPAFTTIVAWSSVSPAIGSLAVPTTAQLSGLADGAYVWRVRANAKGADAFADTILGSWSAGTAFTVQGSSAAAAPPVIDPLVNGGRFHPFESFGITWQPVANAKSYLFEYSNSSAFTLPAATFYQANTLSTASAGFDFGEVASYFGRVSSIDVNGVRSLPSPVVSFSITFTAPVPPAPLLASPADAGTSSLPTTFSWTDAADPYPQGYELQIAKDGAFAGGCGTIELCVNNLFATSYTVSTLAAGTKFWRVRSYHGNASALTAAVSAWSTVRSFTVPNVPAALAGFTTTVLRAGGTTVADPPVAYSGANGDNLVYGNLQLTAPASATDEVLLSAAPAGILAMPTSVLVGEGFADYRFAINPGQVDVPTTVTLTATFKGKQLTTQLIVQPPDIRAVSVNGGLPKVPSISGGTPATGAVEFNGQAPVGTAISLSSDSPAATVPAQALVQSVGGYAGFTITTSPVTSVTPVTITATWKGQTATAHLTLYPPPTPLSPASGASVPAGSSVSFSWSPTFWNYQFQILDAGGAVVVDQPGIQQRTQTTATVPVTARSWQVRSTDIYGVNGPWSAPQALTVSGPVTPLAPPAQQTPGTDARFNLGQLVTFGWAAVNGAGGYELQVSTSTAFSSLAYSASTGPAVRTTGTSTLPKQNYVWRVRATGGAWSGARTFRVG